MPATAVATLFARFSANAENRISTESAGRCRAYRKIQKGSRALRLLHQERSSATGTRELEGLVHTSSAGRSTHFGETATVWDKTSTDEGHPLASIGSGFVREPGQFFPPFVDWLR